MEQLKLLAELTEPDVRQGYFVVRDSPAHPFRPLASEDIHEMAVRASLHSGVPEDVRSHFAMAQNLLAYSWFCYPFNVAAELHGYITVEFALKTRFPDQPRASLRNLLDRAVAEGLLKSEDFTYGRVSERQLYPPEMEVPTQIPDVRDYVSDVARAMRSLRNSIAHGEPMIHNKGGTALLICSELINQLFPVPQ